MKKQSTKSTLVLVLSTFFIMSVAFYFVNLNKKKAKETGTKPVRLYWFVPDGLRAEPVTFKIYEWANAGLLPNLKKLMNEGSYGYSIPVFPGHTPTNFATLMTGTTPDVHGIADGPMRIEGYPLQMVSKGGFTSQAKKVPPIWYTMEQNKFLVSLLSIPGSTPPELNDGITIKGRWGGWGIEFPAIVFHSEGDELLQVETGLNKRVFNFGSELTKFLKAEKPKDWELKVNSYSPAREINLLNWQAPLFALVYDSTDDGVENYDRVTFSKDKKTVLVDIKEGEWGEWRPVSLSWELKNDYNIYTPKKMQWERDASSVNIDTDVKIKVIKLGKKDYFRIRFLYDHLNEFLVKPSYLYGDIRQKTGPMVDFVDNYPPQLIYINEDKKTFMEESQFSFDWHNKMAEYMMKSFGSDVIIQSIYSPNQMLTSRWWMPYVDPKSPKYKDITEDQRKILWEEILGMYKNIDRILGTVLENADEKTYIVFSSDHGAVPLYKEVRLNNLFAKKGWLKFKYSKRTGEYEIDWAKTKVIFLQMDNIYIHPNGLDNVYRHASGPEYEALRSVVMEEISKLTDDNGIKPLAQVLKREEAHQLFLPPDRTGDLIIANTAHYVWVEDVSDDLVLFKDSLKGGYKQGILPGKEIGMWTPFVIKGPGIKRNNEIVKPINHVDQYATILKLLKQEIPGHNKGRVLEEILE
ncbi:MAG: alkaline phosphatase family protein [Bacteriovorax sp.]|jgi:predicted AlkP superfamily phosphohydrolase/phosphomutase